MGAPEDTSLRSSPACAWLLLPFLLLPACGTDPRPTEAAESGWLPETGGGPTGEEAGADPPAPSAENDDRRTGDVGEPELRDVPASHRLAYDEVRPKSVLELQPWRKVESANFTTTGGRDGVATLVDLNPAIGAWLLLRIEWVGGGDPEVYHLENPFPEIQRVLMDQATGTGLVFARNAERVTCDLWSDAPDGALARARAGGRPFAPVCGEWLYVRNRTEGRRTPKEWAADFLRDRVWGGEKITTLVRDTVFKNGYRRIGRLSAGDGARLRGDAGTPAEPLLAPQAADRRIEASGLGLSITRERDGLMAAGRWYPVTEAPGVFVSALRPDLVAGEIVARQATRVNPLDSKEGSSLVYVVAFDLARLELGFALGTEHPRVNWSERAPDALRDDSLPGPDGIGTVAPLVRTGVLSPAEAVRVAATFTGGFKRSHGAFNTAELAAKNFGSHYGFVEQGVILSKLQPGLSTLAVFRNGRVFVGTWSTELDRSLADVRFARQNGVPILELDPATGQVRPGSLVKRWGAGNWSGSADKELRTLRAGTCIQERPEGSFLLYGFFTSATPSGMARVFEAYGCGDAMQLDMNALEHTYLAVYREGNGRRVVERLIDEMEVLDKVIDGETVPRFVGFPDNRDFFFLSRRPQS